VIGSSFPTHRPTLVRSALAVCFLASAYSTNVGAQGSISMQGFGYPLTGASTRTAGVAGAIGEFDPVSPINPAALIGIQRSLITIQAEPEYRTLTLNSVRDKATIQRIPLIALALRITSRAVVSLSDAGFLDRSYTTATTGTAIVDGQLLATQDNTSVKGAISDFRAAFGYQVTSRLALGVAGHVFTGDSRLNLTRQFSDTTKFGTVSDTSGIDFVGRALSFGAQLALPKGIVTSASYRAGGEMRAERKSAIISNAKVPNRLGLAVLYNGISGATFAANVDHTNWTALAPLGSSALETHDATNWSVGTELEGSKVRGAPILYRLGLGHNTLPFGINGAIVTEQKFAAGATLPITNLSREQAAIDFSVQRAFRKLPGSPVNERAWLLGIGFQIRP
jgi:hypothetical protein